MKASIIIPTYNNIEILKGCVNSVLSTTDLTDKEIIIVANGCEDATIGYLRSVPKEIKWIWSDIPLGYVGAINAGLHKAEGEYIILLNDDIVLLQDTWFDFLLKPFIFNNKCGITGPSKWWKFGYPIVSFWCTMFRKDILNKIGYLDDIFNPGNGEDIDFCIKISKIEKEIISVPIDYKLESEIENTDFTMFPINHLGGRTFSREHEKTMELRKKAFIILQERYGI